MDKSFSVLIPIDNEDLDDLLITGRCTLGRGLSNKHIIAFPYISREHCIFNCDELFNWTITTLGANPISVNKTPLSKDKTLTLKHNDVISFSENLRYKFSCLNCHTKAKEGLPKNKNAMCAQDYQAVLGLQCKLLRETAEKDKVSELLKDHQEQLKDHKEQLATLTEENKQLQLKVTECETDNENLKKKTTSEAMQLLLMGVSAEVNHHHEIVANNVDRCITYLLNIKRELTRAEEKAMERPMVVLNELFNIKQGMLNLNEKHLKMKNLCENNSDQENLVAPVKQSLYEMLQTDLECSICNGLYIKATSLNCSHTFCKFCIDKWKLRKSECPVCRTPITKMTHSIAINNFIENILTRYYPEKLVSYNENKAQQEASTSATQQETSEAPPILVITDSSDESESESESENDNPTFWGGYGHCFVCGAPDHWANSCPHRRSARY